MKKSFYNGSNNYYPATFDKIEFAENTDDKWKEFRQEIMADRSKSQDDFEKYINVFSSGGLVIGLTLMSKFTEKDYVLEHSWTVILATLIFLVSLMSNLWSHRLAIKNSDKTLDDIRLKNPTIFESIDKRNNCIELFNIISIWSFFIGAAIISFFLILNINTMSKKIQTPQGKPKTTQSEPKPLNEEKGRTSTKPSFEIKPKK